MHEKGSMEGTTINKPPNQMPRSNESEASNNMLPQPHSIAMSSNDTDTSETVMRASLLERVENAEVIENSIKFVDPIKPLRKIGEFIQHHYQPDENTPHYEFGPYGLSKKFFGDQSELVDVETRLSKEELHDISIQGATMDKRSDNLLSSWRLKRRQDVQFEFDSRVDLDLAEAILNEKNDRKTVLWTEKMSDGLLDILTLASAIVDDAYGLHKGPMFLPLLSFYIADITSNEKTDKRVFKFYLEYGIGSRCLKWTIVRTLDQIESLNRRLTNVVKDTFDITFKKPHTQLPPFPKFRKLANKQAREQNEIKSGAESIASDTSIRLTRMQTRLKNLYLRPKIPKSHNNNDQAGLNKRFLEEIQLYMEDLVQLVNFREDSLRLFQFFEMSPFSMLLNNEVSIKRKEGSLFIGTSAKKQGWRVGHLRFHDLTEMVDRHTNKWFILGDSFLMYTADISSTTPLDIFLFDSFTEIKEGEHKKLKSEIEGSFENPKEVMNKSKKYYSGIEIKNNERKLTLATTQKYYMDDWIHSIKKVIDLTEWTKKHRFGSFAPIRNNAFAQWFVDGRDYMYAASSAIEMAKDVIYIHDWWLSPELYLRRPANGNQDWRIDRLLKRKAKQGVKIYIIIYRNVGNTVVTDSLYTKHSLLDLDNNIYVLRSPNQIMQNVFFWAHHEKLLIVDNTVCFLGGIDLCFGRWDTPGHVLTDDHQFSYSNEGIKPSNTTPVRTTSNEKSSSSGVASSSDSNEKIQNGDKISDGVHAYHIFPGKDYSNPRKKDFFNLPEPNEDMYDRQVTPRMPWHDIHMVTGGQVARDLARHFVQRWNYLIRQKRPSRPTPLLVPPRKFTEQELKDLKLTGTCEVQLLRSSGDWSLGLKLHEQSIHDAYIKCIETSEHFVYIENQFFVTSCKYDGVVIKNSIGDALVDRIIQAHKKSHSWKAIIVIPLMPGFEANVDSKEGGSVRLIMQLQYMSISMGDDSIFSKLRRVGINPEEYIQFFSLRKWGLIGSKKLLTTEQLYVHAKCMIIDDRIAIIGSANINERSMRGVRDSEVAAIIRDTNMIDSKMDERDYKVGHFAHTLRMRLMREHLGVDVDLLDMVERRFAEIQNFSKTDFGLKFSIINDGDIQLSSMVEIGTRYLLELWDGTEEFKKLKNVEVTDNIGLKSQLFKSFKKIVIESSNEDLDDYQYACSFNHRSGAANRGLRNSKTFSTDNRVTNKAHRNDIRGLGSDGFNSHHFIDAKIELNKFLSEHINDIEINSDISTENILPSIEDVLDVLRQTPVEDGSNDELNKLRWVMIKRLFYLRKLYSKGLNELHSAKSKQHSDHSENNHDLNLPVKPEIDAVKLTDIEIEDIDKTQLPQLDKTFIDPWSFADPLNIDFNEGTWMVQALKNTLVYQMVFHCQPDDAVQSWRDYKYFEDLAKTFNEHQEISCGATLRNNDDEFDSLTPGNETDNESTEGEEVINSGNYEYADTSTRRFKRRQKLAELKRYQRELNNYRGGGVNNGIVYEYETAKKLLGKIRGNVVLFPTRWLKREVESLNWFYKADRLPPIQIYD